MVVISEKVKAKSASRNKYVEYDYEAEFNEQVDKLNESYLEKLLKRRYIKSIYTTKTIKAGNQLEVEIYPAFAKDEVVRSRRKCETSEKQKNLNNINARKYFERKVHTNFTSDDLWITYTFINKYHPASFKEALDYFRKYIRTINAARKKLELPNAKYMYVVEKSAKGRFHFHVVMDGFLSMDVVVKKWKYGKRTEIRPLDYDEKEGLIGLSKYVTKDNRPDKGERKWGSSKGNLKEPKVSKSYHKFRNKNVLDMVGNQNAIPEVIEKKYPGYKFKDVEIKHNRINGKFYIRARLYEPFKTKKIRDRR